MNNGDGSNVERRAPAFDAIEPEEGTTLLRTLHLLRRRFWILAAVLALAMGLAGVAASSQPRRYRSEATIEVGPDRPLVSPDTIGDPREGSSLLWENHFRTQEALLRRPGLLAQALDALPADEVAEFRSAPDPIRRLSEDLDIDSVPSTFLIRIALDHSTPGHGPALVNKIVELFIDDANRRLKELKTGALAILDTEALPLMRRKVDESERRLREFHALQGLGDLEEQYAGLQEAKRRIGARLSEVRLRRIEIETRPRDPEEETGRASAGTDRDEPLAMDALVTRRTELEVELARQSGLLKDRHPTLAALKRQVEAVRGLIEEARRARAESRARDRAAVDLEEKALVAEEERLDRRMSEAQVRRAELRELQGAVAADRELYNSYLKKQGEVKATAGAGLTSVRIVDLARDPREVPLRPGLFLSLGAVLGLLFGTIALLVAEQVDDRIATARHAGSALGLDVLAAIPAMAPGGRREGPLAPLDDPASSPLEPFRHLRTEVEMRLHDTPGPKVVAVLGPQEGEGKSTIAVNLARVLALEGHRVLLLDGDLRRPRLKAALAEDADPGLDEVLRGEVPVSRAIQPTPFPGVSLLGARRGVEGPAETPGSQRFRALWGAVRATFDYVVVDTSPVNRASEVPVIARRADASLLVVEERRTGARPALAARRRLENHGVRLLGLVVNRSHAVSPGTQPAKRLEPAPVNPEPGIRSLARIR